MTDPCGRPTKKGTPCRRELHSWIEGLQVRRADGCWRHMDQSFKDTARRRQDEDEAKWQAYLGADPICWSWPIPSDLESWTYPQSDDINEQLSPEALDMLMRNPERRADAILRNWQDGRCAICGHQRSLVEDHDHVTGLTRGYLCRSCNIQEGVYRHGVHLFSRYRERHPTKMLGLSIRYWDPITGEYAPQQPASTEAERQADKWADAASEDIGRNQPARPATLAGEPLPVLPPSARGLCHPAAMNHEDQPPQHDDDSLDDIPDIEGEPPPVGEYRLSTRGPVVGGGS